MRAARSTYLRAGGRREPHLSDKRHYRRNRHNHRRRRRRRRGCRRRQRRMSRIRARRFGAISLLERPRRPCPTENECPAVLVRVETVADHDGVARDADRIAECSPSWSIELLLFGPPRAIANDDVRGLRRRGDGGIARNGNRKKWPRKLLLLRPRRAMAAVDGRRGPRHQGRVARHAHRRPAAGDIDPLRLTPGRALARIEVDRALVDVGDDRRVVRERRRNAVGREWRPCRAR